MFVSVSPKFVSIYFVLHSFMMLAFMLHVSVNIVAPRFILVEDQHSSSFSHPTAALRKKNVGWLEAFLLVRGSWRLLMRKPSQIMSGLPLASYSFYGDA